MRGAVVSEVSLARARNELSKLVLDVETTHARVMVTKHGRPTAVLMSPDDLESLEETLDILSESNAMDEIRQSEGDIAAGDVFDEEAIRRAVTHRAATA